MFINNLACYFLYNVFIGSFLISFTIKKGEPKKMNNLKLMLESLKKYGDCEITHTISHHKQKVISISYNKAKKMYQITYLPTLSIEYYSNIQLTVTAIDKALDNLEVSR
jgi:hypothetical protein